MQHLYCKVAAKSLDNTFQAGKLYDYALDLHAVYDDKGEPYVLGNIDDKKSLTVYVDYFNSKSQTLATFVEV